MTLRAKADLSGITGSRTERLRTVILRLQAKADREQKPFEALVAAWTRAGRVQAFQRLWIVNGFAITATPDVIDALARNPAVESVTPDETMLAPAPAATSAMPEWNVSTVGAPAMWSLGHTGQGVVVASLDTGVDASHPDLASRYRGGTNSWYDPFGQHPAAPVDLSGHGTEVTGVMVGGDAGGTSIGVAPGARWIAARIYDDRGRGTASTTHLAFQWILDPDHDPATADAPQVVNNSWSYSYGCNLEFAPDIQALRAAGIVPVFAAGNYGTVNPSPANNPGALAVGATTASDTIASYSSRGPSSCGEPSTIFPELTAPGDGVRSSDLYGSYTTQSGTSLAAPHVAGAIALLLGARPGLSVSQLEQALEEGATDLGAAGADNAYGYGRLDVLGALGRLSSPDFTLDATPAAASTTAGGAVTYTVSVSALNGFAGDVSLSLSGLPPTGGTWGFAPASVTGGAGSSTLTITTSATLSVGTYPLTITGTSGPLSHTVSAALVVSPPPDFALTVAPASATTTAGGLVSYTVAVSSVAGFAGDVALSLSGLPSQATGSFNPVTVSGGSGSSLLTITTTGSTPAGTYALTLTGRSGGLVHGVAAELVVTAPQDYSVTASPASASVKRGSSTSYAVTVSATGGFSAPVALSVTGLPKSVTASFSKTPVTPPAISSLTVKVGKAAKTGTSTLTIVAKSGSTTRSTTVTLTVT